LAIKLSADDLKLEVTGGGETTTETTSEGEGVGKKQLYIPRNSKAHWSMLYGPSGALKTWEALQFCDYILERYGKITRYISCDEGGAVAVENAREAGLIDVVYVGQGESAMAMASKLMRGLWPRERGGEIIWLPFSHEDEEEVGAYVVDSITSLCNLVMQEVSRTGKHLTGDPKDGGMRFKTYGETIANYTRGNYTIAQFIARQTFTDLSNLPVPRGLITARESRGEDQEGATIYGPATAGKALIKDTPAAVGEIFHLTSHVSGEGTPQEKLEFRMYFTPHPTETPNVNWFAKPRLDGEALRTWFDMYKEGYYQHGEFAGKSIKDYLEHQDKYGRSGVEGMRQKVKRLRGKGGEK